MLWPKNRLADTLGWPEMIFCSIVNPRENQCKVVCEFFLFEFPLLIRYRNFLNYLNSYVHICYTRDKGLKLMISTIRWGRRSKIVLKIPPEISRRIFWCNKKFWKRNFQHPIKPEVYWKWRYTIFQLAIKTIPNLRV